MVEIRYNQMPELLPAPRAVDPNGFPLRGRDRGQPSGEHQHEERGLRPDIGDDHSGQCQIRVGQPRKLMPNHVQPQEQEVHHADFLVKHVQEEEPDYDGRRDPGDEQQATGGSEAFRQAVGQQGKAQPERETDHDRDRRKDKCSC